MIFVVCLNRDGRDSGMNRDFGCSCLGIRGGCGGGGGSASGPAPPRALTPALSRRAGEGVCWWAEGDSAGGLGVWGSGWFCEAESVFLRGAVVEGESFWPLPSPGPLPPSGRGGFVGDWWRFSAGGWGVGGRGGFGLGSLSFCEGALRFLRGAWAVLERPLRDGGPGVLGRGLWDGGVFAGWGVALRESFWPLLPGILRCCLAFWASLARAPYVFDEGGGWVAEPVLPYAFGVAGPALPFAVGLRVACRVSDWID